jgi:formiminoglutamase
MNNDPRLKDFIKPTSNKESAVQLIGFPSDEGVKINGGRPGASKAPSLIFDQLQKFTPHAHWFKNHTELLNSTAGLNIIECSGDLENDQKLLGESVASCLGAGVIPVIIGGGHETSFGHFLGYTESDNPVHIINIDAHTDVRPLKAGKAHSGSPFRQALEDPSGLCKSYNVFGLNPASVSQEHLNFVKSSGLALFESELRLENVRRWFDKAGDRNIMVTMDMDTVQHSEAPGVSAPNPSGISKELWLKLAFEFGKQPNVISFDLCEVNPEFDRDDQTVKLAALTIWKFLLGVALR